MKIHAVSVELLHADRRTERQTKGKRDMTKIIVAFRNFANELSTIYGTGSFLLCSQQPVNSAFLSYFEPKLCHLVTFI